MLILKALKYPLMSFIITFYTITLANASDSAPYLYDIPSTTSPNYNNYYYNGRHYYDNDHSYYYYDYNRADNSYYGMSYQEYQQFIRNQQYQDTKSPSSARALSIIAAMLTIGVAILIAI